MSIEIPHKNSPIKEDRGVAFVKDLRDMSDMKCQKKVLYANRAEKKE